MAYTPFTTRAALLAYIKRKLGEVSHTVELSNDQWSDAIDDAVQLFIEKAFDGTDQYYETLNITTGTQIYTLDPDVAAVLDIQQVDFVNSNQVAMQSFYSAIWQDISSNSSEIILNYAMTRSYLSSIESLVMKDVLYGYNGTTHQLTFHESINVDPRNILLHTVRHLGGIDITEENPSTFDNIYGNRFIKARAEANAWVNWGNNLIKYDAPLYDGNIQINVDRIIEMGDKLTLKTDEMLKAEFQDSFGLYAF